jgi:hypothetical protein
MGADTGPLLAGQKAYILVRLDGLLSEEQADQFDEALAALLEQFNGVRMVTSFRAEEEGADG